MMGRRVDTVEVAKKPFSATFAKKMLRTSSPSAVRTMDNSEAVFNREFFELDVNVSFTSEALEVPSGRVLRAWRSRSGGGGPGYPPEGAGPPAH